MGFFEELNVTHYFTLNTDHGSAVTHIVTLA